MNFSFQPAFAQVPYVKLSYNVGCLLDIPTGVYEFGRHGESLLNGGVGPITGIVGYGNNFKSTFMQFMSLKVLARFSVFGSTMNTYDTEINIILSRLAALANKIEEFNGENPVDSGRWQITDKTLYFANEWYELWKEFIELKYKGLASCTYDTPFIDRDGTSLMRIAVPTISQVDSFTEFETQDAANMQADNELGDSGANTLFMRQGISKTRFLTDVPKLIAKANNPMFLTAHIGKEIPMDARAAPVKKLQFLKNGDKIKGATDKFTFLTTNCWQCQNSLPMINDTTKGPEYPRHSEDNMKFDTDLFLVTVVNLRCKTGPSGLIMQIIVSQQDGVQASLSEFHYIKTVDRYGIGGNVQNYYLELAPEIKLSRTAIRGKIDKEPALRRALEITSEMCQMKMLWHNLDEGLMCTPKELYDDLKAMGYDWNVLLDTRGWWTLDNDNQPKKFLSTMDLLRMRKKLYHPYWMELLPGMSERPPVQVLERSFRAPTVYGKTVGSVLAEIDEALGNTKKKPKK